MARGRFITKDISLDQKVDELSDDTSRLLFTWLIPHLDCEGRMHGEPGIVRSQVFPRKRISDAKIEKYLQEMEKLKLIFRYSDGKERFIFKPNFEKHQVGLRKDKESPSVIPPPPDNILTYQVPTNDGVNPGKDKDEVKDKDNIKVKTAAAELFRQYAVEIEKLRGEFPELAENFDSHIKNCIRWWDQQKKQLKDPVKAARNWLMKERSNLKTNPPGITGRSRQLRTPGEIPSDADLD